MQRSKGPKCSSFSHPHPGGNDENEAEWVIVDTESRSTDDENDRSPIEVSKVSSPLTFRLNPINNLQGNIHISVPWPIGLSWFQFQDACFNDLISYISITQRHCAQAASDQNTKHSDDQNDKNLVLHRRHPTSLFAQQNFLDLGSHKGFQEAVSEMDKHMPGRCEGENAARLRALVSTDPDMSKMKEIEIFAYKLSNNLIEGASAHDQHRYDSVLSAKYFGIIDMYHEIDLPRTAWRRFFKQNLRSTSSTSSAVLEKLFEAAIMTAQHAIVELLLEAGADPNQPVRDYFSGVLLRPLQYAVQRRTVDLDLVKMLIGFGASPNLTLDSDTTTALERAATNCSLRAIVVLVEAGADIRVPAGVDGREDENANGRPTVLTRAIEAAACSHNIHCRGQATTTSGEEKGGDYDTKEEEEMVEEEEKLATNNRRKENCEELAALEILTYLVPLYNQDTDHETLQGALLAAAGAGRTDMFDILLTAGARINELSWPGYTPLIATAQRCCFCKSFRTVCRLLDLGADPNRLVKDSEKVAISALHVSALRGHESVVQLLVDRGASLKCQARIAKYTIYLFGEPKKVDDQLLEDIRQCKTPLELALVNYRDSYHGPQKTAATAMILVRAGAELLGGEFARAPSLGDASTMTMSLLQELIACGADVNELDQAGNSALYNAIVAAAANLVSYLLEIGVVLHGNELRHAVRAGNQEIVETILRHRGLPRIKDDENRSSEQEQISLLEMAALSKNWSLMAWLTSAHSLPYDPAALCAAIGLGLGTWHQCSYEQDLPHLEVLLSARPTDFEDDSPMEATALAYAVFNALTNKKRYHPLLQRLLEIPTFGMGNAVCILPEKEDSSWYGGTIVSGFSAVNSSNIWSEHFWRDPGMARCSLLAPFIALEKWEVVERLLCKGCKPDHISLLVAIRNASLTQIRMLTEHMSLASLSGAWPCRFDTPLQAATRLRRKEVIQRLLHLGVDVNAAPATQKIEIFEQITEFVLPRTAFQAAVENGDLDIMELLLEAGADLNAPPADDSGATALQIAAATGQIGIARKLIALGADIDANGARAHGRTALEAAAEHGRLDMVHFLVEVGAKILEPRGIEGSSVVDYRDDDGPTETTPLIATRQLWRAKRLAARNGHTATSRLLRTLKSKQDTRGDDTDDDSADGNYLTDSDDLFATSDEDDGNDYSDESEGSNIDGNSGGESDNYSYEGGSDGDSS